MEKTKDLALYEAPQLEEITLSSENPVCTVSDFPVFPEEDNWDLIG